MGCLPSSSLRTPFAVRIPSGSLHFLNCAAAAATAAATATAAAEAYLLHPISAGSMTKVGEEREGVIVAAIVVP